MISIVLNNTKNISNPNLWTIGLNPIL